MPSKWINSVPPEVIGLIMSMVIAFLRVIYDKQETKFIRVLLEVTICGCLSLVASSGITAAGLDSDWAIFTGGCIGFMGSMTIRALALDFVKKKSTEKPK